MSKVTPFLMFDDQLEDALDLYAKILPGTKVEIHGRHGEDGPVQAAEFTLGGQRFMAYNGGDHFRFTDAFSFFVDCKDQTEVDEYWDKLVAAGAKPVQCGWITDPFGVSWQIVPRRFMQLMADDDPKKVKAVVDAMMTMEKLDVAALENAFHAAHG